MIDIKDEEVLTLKDAAAILPRRRRGRKPHISTIYRWATRGLKGLRLETLQIGGTLCTSVEALQRFFEQLTRSTPQDTPPASRRRSIAQAESELNDAGI